MTIEEANEQLHGPYTHKELFLQIMATQWDKLIEEETIVTNYWQFNRKAGYVTNEVAISLETQERKEAGLANAR